jgi:hypothetical protein
LAVQWLNEALCFVSSFVVAESLVLRNRELLVAANRNCPLTIAVNYYHVAETENQEWTILFQYIDLKVAILNLMKIWFYHEFNG